MIKSSEWGLYGKEFSESRTWVASEWKNDIITLHRTLFGSIFRVLYLERSKTEIVETCKEIYCGGIKYMPIYKQETPGWTKGHRGQHISKPDLWLPATSRALEDCLPVWRQWTSIVSLHGRSRHRILWELFYRSPSPTHGHSFFMSLYLPPSISNHHRAGSRILPIRLEGTLKVHYPISNLGMNLQKSFQRVQVLLILKISY